ncbi:Meiotically up-regulated protein 113 [Colletotrichum sp. SAR 10_77]|nr:Meiotically up-regulated protein 113 [Colletotrichum sp. SAR 10_77]
MGYVANTPEDRLGRSDSKNPNTTCKGLTTNGNFCRNPVTPVRGKRLSPTVKEESLYCHHHRDQAASRSSQSSPGPRVSGQPILEERTSIDTLADRLGLVDIGSDVSKKNKRPRPNAGGSTDGEKPQGGYSTQSRPRREITLCCCFTIPLEFGEDPQEENIPPRPQPRPVQNGGSAAMPPASSRPSNNHLSPNASTSNPGRPSTSSRHSRKSSSNQASPQPLSQHQTAQYLALIPGTTEPSVASALMAELARPYGSSEEPGYIYMFWIMATSKKASAPVNEARGLLSPPSADRGGGRQRRTSDVASAVAHASKGAPDNKMLIKIGRAANVQRRMQQWSRQCSYDIEVLRYYPYIPGASQASGEQPRMVPHVHRVERLIHLELQGMGLHAGPINCDGCTSVHREWFQIDASKKGIQVVDEVIRRWCDFDETQVP